MSNSSRILRHENLNQKKFLELDPKRTVVAVSFGPLEVHGPHLPIGQDVFESDAILERVLAEISEERGDLSFLVLPRIPIATDCVPQPGSINYPVILARDVAYHTLLPFAKLGFSRLVISSFHGGPRHICCMEDAADKLSKFKGVDAISMFSATAMRLLEGNAFFDIIKGAPGRDISEEQLKQDQHAGFVETALALALWPELVDRDWDKIPPCVVRQTDMLESYGYGGGKSGNLIEQASAAMSGIKSMLDAFAHFKKHTYGGYPAQASREQGEYIVDCLAKISREVMNGFLDGADIQRHTPAWKLRNIFMSDSMNQILEGLNVY